MVDKDREDEERERRRMERWIAPAFDWPSKVDPEVRRIRGEAADRFYRTRDTAELDKGEERVAEYLRSKGE